MLGLTTSRLPEIHRRLGCLAAAALLMSCSNGSEEPCYTELSENIGFSEVDFYNYDFDRDGVWSADECAAYCELLGWAEGADCTYDIPPTDTAGGYGSAHCSGKFYTFEAYC